MDKNTVCSSEASGFELENIKVAVKEEPVIFLDEDDENTITTDGVGRGGGGGDPKPIQGLHEMGPPPFLKKTYEMVDDPSIDSIISWSRNNNSFVVWDPYKLSTDVLPKHFKHNNFSSFIRQLNTYRFRKIDSDRWEFANEAFQKGKKHLLKNIKRRRHYAQPTMMPRHGSTQLWLDSNSSGVEAEVQKLRNDHNLLKNEVLKLRKQQENTESYLKSVRDRLQCCESKQKHMVIFMTKAFSNPLLMKQFVEKVKQKKALRDSHFPKKRRLESSAAFVKCSDQWMGSGMKTDPEDAAEELATIQSEISTLFSSDDSESPVQDQNRKPYSGTDCHDTGSENFVLWEKLMEDDMIYENGGEGTFKHQSADMILELEDLVST